VTIEDIAELILKDWQLQPRKLPTGVNQTPDFHCCDGRATYLIEFKSKEDGVDKNYEKERALNEQGFHISWQSNRRTNTLSGIASDAARQLSSSLQSADYRIIWFLAIGENSKRWFDKFVATLYGITQLADLGKSPLNSYPCYFFSFSDFFRHKDVLDAAIVSYPDPESPSLHSIVCLNPHSERYANFKKSKLVSLFGTSVVDPPAQESDGTAYIADEAIDRRDVNAMIEYLRKKYLLPKLDIAEMSTLAMETRTRV